MCLLPFLTMATRNDTSIHRERQLERTVPTSLDVLCGTGHDEKYHIGNKVFNSFISQFIEQYTQAQFSRNDKIALTKSILDALTESGTRFLKKCPILQQWYIAEPKVARDKIGHILRTHIRRRTKSIHSMTSNNRRTLANMPNLQVSSPFPSSIVRPGPRQPPLWATGISSEEGVLTPPPFFQQVGVQSSAVVYPPEKALAMMQHHGYDDAGHSDQHFNNTEEFQRRHHHPQQNMLAGVQSLPCTTTSLAAINPVFENYDTIEDQRITGTSSYSQLTTHNNCSFNTSVQLASLDQHTINMKETNSFLPEKLDVALEMSQQLSNGGSSSILERLFRDSNGNIENAESLFRAMSPKNSGRSYSPESLPSSSCCPSLFDNRNGEAASSKDDDDTDNSVSTSAIDIFDESDLASWLDWIETD